MKIIIFAAGVLVLIALAGCAPQSAQFTPTTNPTLIAVEQMLTQTSAAPTATPTPTSTPTSTATPVVKIPISGSSESPAGPGETVQFGQERLTVLSVSELEQIGGRLPGEGQAFVDVEVRIQHAGNSEEEIAYTPSYFSLAGQNGRQYRPLSQPVEPPLRSGRLRPGEYVNGHVTFEAPAGGEYLLRYFSGSYEFWVDLSLSVSDAAETPARPAVGTAGLPVPGQRMEAAGLALEVNQEVVHQDLPGASPAEGRVFLELLVQIYNIDRPAMPYNPAYFRIRDLEGYEWGPASILPEESLGAGMLKHNQRVIGRVMFEVPREAVQPGSELVLIYLPSVLFEERPYEEIRILLSPAD